MGSREARRLRQAGPRARRALRPLRAPHAIAVPERELRRALTSVGGLNAILDVVLEGQKTTHPSILKEYQQDPIKGSVTHIDLQEVRLDQPIHATVPVHLVGARTRRASRRAACSRRSSRDVNVEALPMEIPEHLDLDVSGMQMSDTLRLADLRSPEGVTLLDDPEETVLATVDDADARGRAGARRGARGRGRRRGCRRRGRGSSGGRRGRPPRAKPRASAESSEG